MFHLLFSDCKRGLTSRIVVYTIQDVTYEAEISSRRIAEECVAVKLRLLTRAVTRLYNRLLRLYALTISQMNILVAISSLGEARQADVCRILDLEKSTLSRDLARLRDRGWVDSVPGEDSRIVRLKLTALGRRLLERATPAWEEGQRQATALLGSAEIAAFGRAAERLQTGLPVSRVGKPHPRP
jgi:DNA-binding MarR family transcriptional regulator